MLVKISMVCAAMTTATTLFAETNNTGETAFATDSLNTVAEPDGVRSYRFGRREVIFDEGGIHFIKDRNNFDWEFDDEDQRYYYNSSSSDWSSSETNNSSKPKNYRYFYSSLSSLDFGAIRFASERLSVNAADSISFMDLSRGFQMAGCFDAAGVPIISRKLGIGVGVGFKCDFYTFSTKNLALSKVDGHLVHFADTSKPYNKSKLTNTYMTVPVVLEYHHKGLSVMVGVEGNMLLWSNTKMKTSSGDKDRKHSNLCQNMFSYNLMAKVGVDCVGAFVRANMSPMFVNGKGPEIYPYSAGISLLIY
jgi:hypothetical protein